MMADKSKIEWTDATWNPIRGCSRVSEGCRNCYAERTAARFSGPGQPYEGVAFPSGGRAVDLKIESLATGGKSRGWTGDVQFIPELLNRPPRWKRPRKIFVNSMSDLFHEKVPLKWIAEIFNVMASATADCGKNHKHVEECWCGPSHTYQILTKRPQRMAEVLGQLPEYFSEHFSGDSPCNLAFEGTNGWPLSNVWLGVSVEDQKTADERIPLLLQTPAAVRWVSYEPALGPVDFSHIHFHNTVEIDSLTGNHGVWRPLGGRSDAKLNWIVVGGESGPGARPAHPNWFRTARDQCRAADVPFFFKQWGEWVPAQSPGLTLSRTYIGTMKDGALMLRVGKKRAGHLLDGEVWQQFPPTPGILP
jgi:protein gp37